MSKNTRLPTRTISEPAGAAVELAGRPGTLELSENQLDQVQGGVSTARGGGFFEVRDEGAEGAVRRPIYRVTTHLMKDEQQ